MSVSLSFSPSTAVRSCTHSESCAASKRKWDEIIVAAYKMRAAGTDDSVVPVIQELGRRSAEDEVKRSDEDEIKLLLDEVRALRAKNYELTKKLEVQQRFAVKNL